MPEWHTTRLRATDDAALWASLRAAGLVRDVVNALGVTVTVAANDSVRIDPIPVVTRETGETTTDADGNTVPVTEPVPGAHCNVYSLEPLSDAVLAVLPVVNPEPTTPVRIAA
ncbi:conserved protein of unknown function (plasmid) [Rhodovastum atsumiense]|uniref:Uncharacterized protein n=1 Tax=Rhodovastum atsumiense TaxID=504468 RepID=A0A5M6IP32_9PROT|nr:hypothetical protein [Rhodovastum atsumiense]KAA5609659.1 hypothetical protein F1189_23130 [Rhodovastum atsumiense]CAH2606418.1 conserved protein of unknown function [Rhodovastum atsumiense]